MTKPMTFDGETMREMNEAELAQHEIDKAADRAEAEARAAKATARQVVLTKLGLTADEVAALLS
jgi:hypothetical protein